MANETIENSASGTTSSTSTSPRDRTHLGEAARRDRGRDAGPPMDASGLDPHEGDTLLELAAGVGDTGFEAAAIIGGSGRLISDLSPAMLDAARRRGAGSASGTSTIG